MALLYVPGGPELLILVLVFALLAVATVVVVIVFFSYRRRTEPAVNEQHIAELETRVKELETDRAE